MLKIGSKGEEVKAWQKFLRRKGFYNCGATGRFGVGVAKATKEWQEKAGVFGDGIVGPITLAAAKADGLLVGGINRQGFADPTIEIYDIASGTFKAPSKKEATDAGIPSAVLEAFRKVESNGKADAVRFEPHIFVRLRPDLAAQIPYTRDRFIWSTVASETDRAAFDHAASLDAEAAIKSTSWGLFQVLGLHLLGLFGHDTGAALEAFDDDPEGISDRLVAQWFAANPRARRAANKTPIDWHDLARCYNGSQYAKHGYHTKLRKAWAAIVGG